MFFVARYRLPLGRPIRGVSGEPGALEYSEGMADQGQRRLSATSLPESAQDDQRRRIRGYLISMGIRTVCFIAAVLTWSPLRPLSLVFFALAAILPYIAVVFANATGKRRIDTMGAVTPPPVPHKEIHGSAREPR